MRIERYRIKITGIVQGVGFRPFIYSAAKSLSLNGWVRNSSGSVIVEAEGCSNILEAFVDMIKKKAPPLSCIKGISVEVRPVEGYTGFTIKGSTGSKDRRAYISPDISICSDCRQELFNASDRRYLYPFINCTNCGPRFTIVTGIPYDRIRTTMKKFAMCVNCAAEYGNPTDRRYHAQPVSCRKCGPELSLIDNNGCTAAAGNSDDTIKLAAGLLLKGYIIAVKGLGGYHLACDANNPEAVKTLRKRKARDDKPFALMAGDYETVLKYCEVSTFEKDILESWKKPVVLLKKRTGCTLPEEIAPGNRHLGVMLPYTPVHLLLFKDIEKEYLFDLNLCNLQPQVLMKWLEARSTRKMSPEERSVCGIREHRGAKSDEVIRRLSPFRLDMLVVTSGNISDEPIFYRDDEAFDGLKHIADYFLTNDRDIFIRTDDSVTRVFKEKEYIIRRSRGYVPLPISLDTAVLLKKDGKSGTRRAAEIPSVLACGGHLKNTFCLNREGDFYLSHHIGDLENEETMASFEEGIGHFKRLFEINADVAAYDLHPGYLSTKYALSLDIAHKTAIQHHHAHIASCMAENGIKGDVIGIAFDGTGYGEDGNLWGSEFFSGGYGGFKREGHLEYARMPGGETAVKEPWRMALSYLSMINDSSFSGNMSLKGLEIKGAWFLDDIESSKILTVKKMIGTGFNSPLTSGMGRLFDAVSAILGIRSRVNYEGQAAIELEYIAGEGHEGEYGFTLVDDGDMFKIDIHDLIKDIVKDICDKIDKRTVASRFHETVACMVVKGCGKIKAKTGLNRVVLSGGVFQNMILLDKCTSRLKKTGYEVFIHGKVPANDGGISLGQAVIAVARCRK